MVIFGVTVGLYLLYLIPIPSFANIFSNHFFVFFHSANVIGPRHKNIPCIINSACGQMVDAVAPDWVQDQDRKREWEQEDIRPCAPIAGVNCCPIRRSPSWWPWGSNGTAIAFAAPFARATCTTGTSSGRDYCTAGRITTAGSVMPASSVRLLLPGPSWSPANTNSIQSASAARHVAPSSARVNPMRWSSDRSSTVASATANVRASRRMPRLGSRRPASRCTPSDWSRSPRTPPQAWGSTESPWTTVVPQSALQSKKRPEI